MEVLMAVTIEKVQYPDTMAIYDGFKWPDDVPKKAWDELTPEQKQRIVNVYRFSGYRPGMYQAISGIQGVI